MATCGSREREPQEQLPICPINENATGAPITVSNDATAEKMETMPEGDDPSDFSSMDLP